MKTTQPSRDSRHPRRNDMLFIMTVDVGTAPEPTTPVPEGIVPLMTLSGRATTRSIARSARRRRRQCPDSDPHTKYRFIPETVSHTDI